jgi:hypothetical protein
VISDLEAQNLDAGPLKAVQHTAFTTSTEWHGDLKNAIQKIQKQKIKNKSTKADITTIMIAIHGYGPFGTLIRRFIR